MDTKVAIRGVTQLSTAALGLRIGGGKIEGFAEHGSSGSGWFRWACDRTMEMPSLQTVKG